MWPVVYNHFHMHWDISKVEIPTQSDLKVCYRCLDEGHGKFIPDIDQLLRASKAIVQVREGYNKTVGTHMTGAEGTLVKTPMPVQSRLSNWGSYSHNPTIMIYLFCILAFSPTIPAQWGAVSKVLSVPHWREFQGWKVNPQMKPTKTKKHPYFLLFVIYISYL